MDQRHMARHRKQKQWRRRSPPLVRKACNIKTQGFYHQSILAFCMLWPVLLQFLPVTEVVTMETRAGSRFFSNSKVWVAHLFKLMDLDSLPEHCAGDGRHPGLEFVEYKKALWNSNFEGAEEAKRNASEGFQGYRLWINGLFAWHKRHPEMSLHFLQMMTRWFGSKHVELTNTAITLCRAVRYQGIRDLTLPLANGLLGVLHADMFPRARLCALELLKDCQAVYPDLDVKLLLELLEAVMSWKEPEVRAQVRYIAAFMLEAMMKDDEAFALANINVTSMALADEKGNMDEAAAKSQKLIGLLREAREPHPDWPWWMTQDAPPESVRKEWEQQYGPSYGLW
eukprot:s3137_g12.t2